MIIVDFDLLIGDYSGSFLSKINNQKSINQPFRYGSISLNAGAPDDRSSS